MIDWKEEVKEYKKQYGDDGDITEYIDSLLPVYYGDIMRTFNDMTVEIEEHHLGQPIWRVMIECIYNEYYESFMEEWYED